jgi:hypothetical protein
MAAITEGMIPNFHDAFTQLDIGQLFTSLKCLKRDRHDGRIDSNADHILWRSLSPRPSVDEDLGIGGIVSHYEITNAPLALPRCRYVVEEDLGGGTDSGVDSN